MYAQPRPQTPEDLAFQMSQKALNANVYSNIEAISMRLQINILILGVFIIPL